MHCRTLMRFRSGCIFAASLLAAAHPFGIWAASKAVSKEAQKQAIQIDRASLLVQRFTFGPRPGEIARVRSMGVESWFEQQLAPEHIDDSLLGQKLNIYPALRLSQEERLARYPTPAMIRQIARTGSLPSDPIARAIISDQVEFYETRQQGKKLNAAMNAEGLSASGPSSGAQTSIASAAGENAPNRNLESTLR